MTLACKFNPFRFLTVANVKYYKKIQVFFRSIPRNSQLLYKRFAKAVLFECGGSTPLYKPYRYVPPPQREGFLRRFGLNIDFAHFGLESGMVYEGIRVVYQCVRFVVTIANK